MNLLYRPLPNRIVRTALKPFARWIPDERLIPVDGPIRVELPNGQEIVMACNPTSHLAKVLYWRGWQGFEYPVMCAFVPLIRRAEVFVDIGANIGYYSLAASALNPNVQVHSFEPLPAAFRYLQRSVALNGFDSVRAEQVALAGSEGTMTFFAARKEKYDAIADHLVATGGFDEAQAEISGTVAPVEVRTTTLDTYVAREIDRPIDLLKIDTESTEHIVLSGSSQVLSEHRPTVLCEVLPGRNSEELEAIFLRHDYTLFRAEPEALRRVERLSHDGIHGNDHVMIPAESVGGRESLFGGEVRLL